MNPFLQCFYKKYICIKNYFNDIFHIHNKDAIYEDELDVLLDNHSIDHPFTEKEKVILFPN